MKLTKQQLKQIIKEELSKTAPATDPCYFHNVLLGEIYSFVSPAQKKVDTLMKDERISAHADIDDVMDEIYNALRIVAAATAKYEQLARK